MNYISVIKRKNGKTLKTHELEMGKYVEISETIWVAYAANGICLIDPNVQRRFVVDEKGVCKQEGHVYTPIPCKINGKYDEIEMMKVLKKSESLQTIELGDGEEILIL